MNEIITPQIKELIINRMLSNEGSKINALKVELAIGVINLQAVNSLEEISKHDIFMLGLELGKLYDFQCETSHYDIDEDEIALTINEVQSFLFNR